MIAHAPDSGSLPRTARRIFVVVLLSFAVIYGLEAFGLPGGTPRAAGACAAAVAAVLIRLPDVLPRYERLCGGRLLLCQVALGFAAVLGAGLSSGMLGFAAGALVLARRRYAAAALLAVGAVIAVDRAGPGAAAFNTGVTALLICLITYGISRLADRVAQVEATRLVLAAAAAAEERLRIAAELDRGLGEDLAALCAAGPLALEQPERLAAILAPNLVLARRSLAAARAAATDFRRLSLAPEAATARALLTGAGIRAEVRVGGTEPLGPAGSLLASVLRVTVTGIVSRGAARRCVITAEERDGLLVLRVADDSVATALPTADRFDDLAGQVRSMGGTLTAGLAPDGWFAVVAAVPAGTRPVVAQGRQAHRLSVLLLAAVLAAFSIKSLIGVHSASLPAEALCCAILCWLQLRWVLGVATDSDRPGRPRGWVPALVLQGLLSYLPFIWFGPAWGGMAVCVSGTILLALPARASWPLVGAVMASMGAVAAAYAQSVPVVLNSIVSGLVTGLIVYALVRLAQLVEVLHDSGAQLARASAVQERLRAARDLHDLLGHSLAAVLLKCELAVRLAERDPARARAELADMAELTEQIRADLRTVVGAAPGHGLSCVNELSSAQSVLAAAGVAVEVDGEPFQVPEDVDRVLSVVLREAVTNVLRHSSARNCRIAVTTRTDQGTRTVRLEVENDGVRPGDGRDATRFGTGLGNLTTRLAAVGGTLTAAADEDSGMASGTDADDTGRWFVLRADLPLPGASIPSPASQPTGLMRDPDGVGPVPGAELGHDRGQMVADRPGR